MVLNDVRKATWLLTCRMPADVGVVWWDRSSSLSSVVPDELFAHQPLDLCLNSVSFLWKLKSKCWLSLLFSCWHMLLIDIQVNMAPWRLAAFVLSHHYIKVNVVLLFVSAPAGLHFTSSCFRQSNSLICCKTFKLLQRTLLSWRTGLESVHWRVSSSLKTAAAHHIF